MPPFLPIPPPALHSTTVVIRTHTGAQREVDGVRGGVRAAGSAGGEEHGAEGRRDDNALCVVVDAEEGRREADAGDLRRRVGAGMRRHQLSLPACRRGAEAVRVRTAW